jgi:hypothetical protein
MFLLVFFSKNLPQDHEFLRHEFDTLCCESQITSWACLGNGRATYNIANYLIGRGGILGPKRSTP